MPSKPGLACRCGGLKLNGVCPKCGPRRRAPENHRASARERGYTHAWDCYSQRYRLVHPWCVTCEGDGRFVRAEAVDHIVPHRGDQALFWDSANHQGLCKRHHDAKTSAGS